MAGHLDTQDWCCGIALENDMIFMLHCHITIQIAFSPVSLVRYTSFQENIGGRKVAEANVTCIK